MGRALIAAKQATWQETVLWATETPEEMETRVEETISKGFLEEKRITELACDLNKKLLTLHTLLKLSLMYIIINEFDQATFAPTLVTLK